MTIIKASEQIFQQANSNKNKDVFGSILYNVKAYGAKGDGVTDDTTKIASAITAAAVTGGIVLLPPGTYITGNLTVPSNVTLWFTNGAKLSINNGATVTVNGYIDAGMYQIFSGLGTVVGAIKNESLYPQWWGAKGDGVNNDAPAINAAIATAQSTNYGPNIEIPPGAYVVLSTIIIRHGTPQQNLTLTGYGARILAGTAGMIIIKIVAFGDPVTFNNIGLTKIFGLKMYGTGDGGSTGISIGKRSSSATDYPVDGIFPSVIKDCSFENVQNGIVYSSARMFIFDNCSISTTISPSFGILIQSVYDGFTGDCWIKNCNLAIGVNGQGINMTATTITTGSSMAGIHVENCVCYGQALLAQTTNALATIKDLFIEGLACDAKTVNDIGMYFNAFSASSISQAFITDVWLNGHLQGLTASKANAIVVTSGKISSTGLQAVDFEDTTDCKLIGLTMLDVNKNGNGGGVVKLGGTGARNKVVGCNLFNTGARTFQTITIASTQTKPIVTQNQTDGTTASLVTNSVAGTEGTNFIVSGNL